jgi:hypothetical protein
VSTDATPRERTQAITDALKARFSPEQLREIYDDLERHWCVEELIGVGVPSGAGVILFALGDACEATA